ncbi:MAG: hypothetical protein JNL19_13305 [Burkholderiales bacterium]|nr:hypothetical protein [Burkholderiales bacterium]
MLSHLRCSVTQLMRRVAPLLALGAATCGAATCNWIGGAGDWHNSAKWSCGAVPSAADAVNITTLSGATLTINSAASAASLTFSGYGNVGGSAGIDVAGLASFAPFSTASFSTVGSRLPQVSIGAVNTLFTLQDTALASGSLATVTVNNTSATAQLNIGSAPIGSLNLQNGGLTVGAPLTITTAFNWSGGTLASTANHAVTVGVGATLTVNTAASSLSLGTPLVTAGTTTWSGIAGLYTSSGLSGAGEWTNTGSMTVNVVGPVPATLTSGLVFGGNATRPFTNFGTLRLNHTNTLQFDWTPGLLNHGVVEVNSGNTLFRWGDFTQFAGQTVLNGGSVLGVPKCCALDNYPIVLSGGRFSGTGTVYGGINNDGGTVVLDGALTVTSQFTQTAKGTLEVAINGTTPGADFGTMSVITRNGFSSAGSPGSVTLAGKLVANHGPAYTPKSGDKFAVISAAGTTSGRTTGGTGNMVPAFAAFAAAGAVTVAEPAAALFLQARPDQPTMLRSSPNGYTLRVVNPTANAFSIPSVQTTITSALSYVSGSTTGALTSNPTISANSPSAGLQTLTWPLSPAISVPSGGAIEFRFAVTSAANAALGNYTLAATAGAASASGVAPLDIRPSPSATNITVTIGNPARQITQNGSNNLLIPRALLGTTPINVRALIACPTELAPCGNLRTVYLGQSYGGRYINVQQMTFDANQSAAQRDGAKAAAAGPGFWSGFIPGGQFMPGQPVNIFPDWDNHRPCIAYNGDGFGLYPTGCVGPGDPVGNPQLYDPSGVVTDAVTAQPIVGATVQLFRQLPGLPDVLGPPAQTRDCRTIDTRVGGPGGVWTGSAPDTGLFEVPGFTPMQISPNVNPQTTGSDGRYGWDVVTGCWYVKVSAPGYAPRISALVGVPPAVTDLDIALQPAPACSLDLDADGSVRPHTDALLLLRYIVNTQANVDLTANAKNPISVVTASTIQTAVEAMRSGLTVDVDGDGVVDSKDALIVMRALLGLRDAALTQGLSFSGSTRSVGADLRTWLNTQCALNLP